MSLEQCTSLLGSEGGYSQTSFSDTNQLSLLSGIDMPAMSLESVQQMDGFPTCECGKGMLDCLIHPSTPESWIASMQDSLAKILALPENKQALEKKRAVASTVKSSASLAWYDQKNCSWKTLQQSLVEDSGPSLVTWPRSGMTVNGYAYVLPIVGRITTEIGGFCWPTPTVCGNYNRKGASATSGDGLATSVKMWPTPTAHDAKDTGTAPSEGLRNTPCLAFQAGGKLNPNWVGWLMGFPIGWAKSKATVMRKYRSKPQQPGEFLEDAK